MTSFGGEREREAPREGQRNLIHAYMDPERLGWLSLAPLFLLASARASAGLGLARTNSLGRHRAHSTKLNGFSLSLYPYGSDAARRSMCWLRARAGG